MLVERMEGRIWVESEEGRGSKFMVAVPVAVVENSEAEEGRAGDQAPSPSPPLPSPAPSPATARAGFGDRHQSHGHRQSPSTSSIPSTSQQETETNRKGLPDSKMAPSPLPAPSPVVARDEFGDRHQSHAHRQSPPTSSTPLTSETIKRELLESKKAEEGGVQVLVVEDEPINRKIMVRMLRKLLGPTATIYEATDGTEAVDLCAQLVSSNNKTCDTTDAGPSETSLYGSSAAESPAGAICTTTKAESVIVNAGSESTINAPSLVVGQGHSCLNMNSHTLPTPPRSPSSPTSPASIPKHFHLAPLPDPNNTSPCITRSPPLSVIFMDIIMPIMDGYTASSRIREMGISTPIVVTTANVADEERGRDLGVVKSIRKPFTKEKIAGVLERVGVL
ncbi:hypothetical protein HK102_013368 [Quaeritorhiza haematococci]|nr:hypothetical protein HK102_013368 [Quaeritorhiza haematococci]